MCRIIAQNKKMTRIRIKIFLWVLWTTSFFPCLVSAARLSVDQQKKIVVQGSDLLLKRDYRAAEQFLQTIVHDNPNEMIGYFGLMALYQTRNLENFDFRFDPSYQEWSEIGRNFALKTIQREETDPWSLLMAGGILGTSGFYHAHNKHWLKGLRDGSTGYHALLKAYRRDHRLFDALLGVGLYEYWRSYFTRKLVFLPFFADKRIPAKQSLALAAQEGVFVGPFAEVSLAFIEHVEKKYPEALVLIDRLLAKYPQNTIFRTLKGTILLDRKDYDRALVEFQDVLQRDPHLTKSYLFMGIAYLGKKDQASGEHFLKKFLEAEPKAPNHWRKQALEPLAQISQN